MKDLSQVGEIFKTDRSCEVVLRAMTATVPVPDIASEQGVPRPLFVL
jgi:hypothetical protein